MKKIVLGAFILLCTACTISKPANNEDKNLEKEKLNYVKYVQELEKVIETEEELPFDIDIKYDKLTEDEIRYQVIIDNPKGDITNVTAIAIHDKQTDDVFPSVGIFEKKMDLIPNKEPKGIILVGYIPYTKSVKSFKCEMKVLINYTYENEEHTSYYLTKK